MFPYIQCVLTMPNIVFYSNSIKYAIRIDTRGDWSYEKAIGS